MHKHNAFTLIELLVVMSIMATLSGMIFIAYEESAADVVTADAYELQTVLQRARSMAINTGHTYAVSFHIENAGDGTVLKNRSDYDAEDFPGRHWYCIIGPDNSDKALDQWTKRYSDKPPLAASNGSSILTFYSLQEYEQTMKQVQAGPIHYLSPGVRFLALSDEDELHRYDTHASYPRPWFGFYDETSKTLYPWGAYNPEIDATLSHPNTGLDYEGNDGPIPYDPNLDTNVYPAEVWGRIHHQEDYSGTPSQTGALRRWPGETGNNGSTLREFGFTHDYVGPDTTKLPGKPRALVNGHWGDYMIFFQPDGQAYSAPGTARQVFFTKWGWTNSNAFDNYDYPQGRRHLRMDNYEGKTGGLYITLCRDVDATNSDLYREHSSITKQPAYNKFDSAEAAFESINPFLRVFVNSITGEASVQNNDHPHMRITPDDLKQQNPYPRGFK